MTLIFVPPSTDLTESKIYADTLTAARSSIASLAWALSRPRWPHVVLDILEAHDVRRALPELQSADGYHVGRRCWHTIRERQLAYANVDLADPQVQRSAQN